ncbi:unnamed protein product [Amoebophrya sp. A25]|nr:unnamed protein product [Amoebophrya sp. A25]|eukprot:GSA25T00023533001.1
MILQPVGGPPSDGLGGASAGPNKLKPALKQGSRPLSLTRPQGITTQVLLNGNFLLDSAGRGMGVQLGTPASSTRAQQQGVKSSYGAPKTTSGQLQYPSLGAPSSRGSLPVQGSLAAPQGIIASPVRDKGHQQQEVNAGGSSALLQKAANARQIAEYHRKQHQERQRRQEDLINNIKTGGAAGGGGVLAQALERADGNQASSPSTLGVVGHSSGTTPGGMPLNSMQATASTGTRPIPTRSASGGMVKANHAMMTTPQLRREEENYADQETLAGRTPTTASSVSSNGQQRTEDRNNYSTPTLTTGQHQQGGSTSTSSGDHAALVPPLASALSVLKNKKARPPAAPPGSDHRSSQQVPGNSERRAARRATLRSQERAAMATPERVGPSMTDLNDTANISTASPHRRVRGTARSSSERKRRSTPGAQRERERTGSVPPGTTTNNSNSYISNVPARAGGGTTTASASSTKMNQHHHGPSTSEGRATGASAQLRSGSRQRTDSDIILDTLRSELQRRALEAEDFQAEIAKAKQEMVNLRKESEQKGREIDTLRLEAKTWPRKLDHYRLENEKLRLEIARLQALVVNSPGSGGTSGGGLEGDQENQDLVETSGFKPPTRGLSNGAPMSPVDEGDEASHSLPTASPGAFSPHQDYLQPTRAATASGGGGSKLAAKAEDTASSSSTAVSKTSMPGAGAGGLAHSSSSQQSRSQQSSPVETVASPSDRGVVGAKQSTKSSSSVSPGTDSAESDWVFVVQGQENGATSKGLEKKHSCYPENALVRTEKLGIRFVSLGGATDRPNQDDFLLAMQRNPIEQASSSSSSAEEDVAGKGSKGGGNIRSSWLDVVKDEGYIALYAVFDGFGENGEECSKLIKQRMAELVFAHSLIFQEPQSVLEEAFKTIQKELGASDSFLREGDGASVAVALLLKLNSPREGYASDTSRTEAESWVVVGSIGDCRVVLASKEDGGSFGAVALTKDHKVDTHKGESARLQKTPGVILQSVAEGTTAVFKDGAGDQGSVLTRHLGSVPHDAVLTSAEVNAYRINAGQDLMLVLGTRGLFHRFSNSALVSQLIGHGVDYLGPVCEKAREGGDDVTAVVVTL